MSVVTVTSTDALMLALTGAQAGDTIQLAPGTYGGLGLVGINVGGVTITSADPNAEAVVGGIYMANSSGITFSNLILPYQANLLGSASVNQSSDIAFNAIQAYGSPTNEIGTAFFFRGSTNVSVSNSEIHDFSVAIAHQDNSFLTITNNYIHDISLDGIRGGGSSNVTIASNTLTNFHPIQAAHNDAIQFWTSNTSTTTHDITIIDNVITRGTGGLPVQGVFMGNENAISYQNVTITNNVLEGDAFHGISVFQADNAHIEHNLVQGYTDMGSWIELANSTNSSVVNNSVTSLIITGDTNLLQTGNVTLRPAAVGDTSVMTYWQSHDAVPASAILSSPSSAPTPPPPVAPPAAPAAPPAPGQLIQGTAANEALSGGTGDDTLNGGGGTDTLAGGAGNDLYIVDNYSTVVSEQPNAGTDTVDASIGLYVLRVNVENLVLTGAIIQKAYGNELDNVITGNNVQDYLQGMTGNDTLIAMGGIDTMTGGAGRDHFQFNALPHGTDLITDFVSGDDTLDLHNLITAYAGSDPVADGWVSFRADATGTTVWVDQDGPGGPGAAVAVVRVAGVTALTESDLGFVMSTPSVPTSVPIAIPDPVAAPLPVIPVIPFMLVTPMSIFSYDPMA